MKRFISLFSVFFLLIFAVGRVNAAFSAFYLDYAIVEHSIKNDIGMFDKLMELNDLGEKVEQHPVGEILAEFWWNRSVINCNNYMTSVMEAWKNRISDKEVQKYIMDRNNKCVQSYIYDNWNEINETILNKYNYLEGKLKKNQSFLERVKGHLWDTTPRKKIVNSNKP